MRTSKYNAVVIITAVTLLLCVILLSVLLYVQGPRVRLVSFEKDPKDTSFHYNANIRITFDRPLENKDYKNQISFTPAIEFDTSTSTQAIDITLKDSFRYDTEYTLTINSDIYDKTGKNMDKPHIHTFATSMPRYVYIERNYGTEFSENEASDDADDHVKIARLYGQAEILFTHPEILTITANSQYIAVAVHESSQDKLLIIDIVSKEITEVELTNYARITNLVMSELGNTVVYTISPDFDSVPVSVYEEEANRVESYSIDSKEKNSIVNEDGSNVQAFSLDIDTYGSTALIQDGAQTYFAVSPFNDFSPIVIGSRTSSFGFNEESSEIIFRDNERFSRYEIATGDNTELPIITENFVQKLAQVNDSIYYSSVNFFQNGSLSYIEQIINEVTGESRTLWSTRSIPDVSLRNFSMHYDGQLIAQQLNPKDCQFDSLPINNQCPQTYTQVYDVTTEKVVTEMLGFNFIWLP